MKRSSLSGLVADRSVHRALKASREVVCINLAGCQARVSA